MGGWKKEQYHREQMRKRTGGQNPSPHMYGPAEAGAQGGCGMGHPPCGKRKMDTAESPEAQLLEEKLLFHR